MVTCPPGIPATRRRRPQTRLRASARAVRIVAVAASTSAAKVATSRDIVESGVAGPKTFG